MALPLITLLIELALKPLELQKIDIPSPEWISPDGDINLKVLNLSFAEFQLCVTNAILSKI